MERGIRHSRMTGKKAGNTCRAEVQDDGKHFFRLRDKPPAGAPAAK